VVENAEMPPAGADRSRKPSPAALALLPFEPPP
jgi:hypothetical protein